MQPGGDPFPSLFKIFEYALFCGIILAFGFLAYMVWKVRYTEHMRKYPLRFLLEFIAFSTLPSIPLWLFMVTRGIPFKTTWRWFLALWVKFAILHLLFEFSGIYQYYFANLRP